MLLNKKNIYEKSSIAEFFELIFLILLSFFLVYYISFQFNRVFFLIFLPFIWLTKRDYFWLAFFFILMENPGGLFSGGLRNDPLRLPLYTVLPNISVSIQEIYFIVVFIKFSLRENSKLYDFLYQKEIKWLTSIFLFLVIFSLIYGVNFVNFKKILRLTISLSLAYSVINILISENGFIRFIKLILPFTFITLLIQIYSLYHGKALATLVKPNVSNIQGIYGTENDILQRPIELPHVIFITFTASLFLLFYKKHKFKIGYLWFINIFSFISIFLSGTRIWFIAFCVAYIFVLLIILKNFKRHFLSLIIVTFLILLLINKINIINNQIKDAWNRITTIEKIIKGDITAGGTVSRYTQRAPRVMKGFYSSSIIFGAGFSNHFYEYADGHVGYHNILLNAGIFGFLLFFYIIFRFLKLPLNLLKTCKNLDKKMLLIVSIIPLLMLLIINSGTQTIGFTPDSINRIILFAYSIILIDRSVKIASHKLTGV